MAAHPSGVAILPAAKLAVIHDAVLARCDLLDGVKDGVLENPMRCMFDPKEIECRSGDGPNCLTTPQVEAVRKIYAGPTNPRTNEKVWSPLYRGSELDWGFFTETPSPIGIATSTLRDAILKDRPGIIERGRLISTATSRWPIGRTSPASTLRTLTSRNTYGRAEN